MDQWILDGRVVKYNKRNQAYLDLQKNIMPAKVKDQERRSGAKVKSEVQGSELRSRSNVKREGQE